jgi:hypothetical protein
MQGLSRTSSDALAGFDLSKFTTSSCSAQGTLHRFHEEVLGARQAVS